MTSTKIILDISKDLSNPDLQIATLQNLLSLSSRGHDLSPAIPYIHRHILKISAVQTNLKLPSPHILSLSLDIILLCASTNTHWEDTLQLIIETLRNPSVPICLVILLKLPHLPHAALQYLLLYSTSSLAQCISNDNDVQLSTRRVCVHAISSMILRINGRPLTAPPPDDDGVRLEKLTTDQHLIILKRSTERLLFVLLESIFDKQDSIAVAALQTLTSFAFETSVLDSHSPIDASKKAMARVIWQVLVASLPRLSDRFSGIFSNISKISTLSNDFCRLLRTSITCFAYMACHVLSTTTKQYIYNNHDTDLETKQNMSEQLEQAQQRANKWIESILLPLSDNLSNIELSSNACISTLTICSYANTSTIASDKTYIWGTRAVRNLLNIISNNDTIPSIVISGYVRDISYALGALSKSESVTTKILSSSVIRVLPFTLSIASRQLRLTILALLFSTLVEHDLSLSVDGNNGSIKTLLKSEFWKSFIINENIENTDEIDHEQSAELVCIIGICILEAAKKIGKCSDADLQLQLTHTWAMMLSHALRSCVPCLTWSTHTTITNETSMITYSKEVFLKLFTAAGQYSSSLEKSQGVSMEEYERMQEILIKSTGNQNNIYIRSCLLITCTKYWISSGIKSESNTGHILKAIWKHLQQNYKDEEIFENELKTGALWSEAKQGKSTPQQLLTQGGYVSIGTKISKQTKQVFNTVSNTLTTVIENRLFDESIAFKTAIGEGTTLKTDLIYVGIDSLIFLTSCNPSLAGKCIKIIEKYIEILEKAESADFIALEAVRNCTVVLKTYEDAVDVNHLPKIVDVRSDNNNVNNSNGFGLGWLENVGDNCVFSSSRLIDKENELSTVISEEILLHASWLSRKKLFPFCQSTMYQNERTNNEFNNEQGDSQILHGSSDPFGIVVSHCMDNVKGLCSLHVRISNRSPFHRAEDVILSYASSGALIPLSDSSTFYSLGTLESNASISQHITLLVKPQSTFSSSAGRIFLNIHLPSSIEQSALPYYVPSADILLLRKPSNNSGIDVFRRRWDTMKYNSKMKIQLSKSQTLDMLIDMLERKSKCLKCVGRMKMYSHVCVMTADSTRGDFITLAAVAPEAIGLHGNGPCLVYVTIRAHSQSYCQSFRDECVDWLSNTFNISVYEDSIDNDFRDLNKKKKKDDSHYSDSISGSESRSGNGATHRMDSIRLQDAFFITEPHGPKLSPYQRWRKAHAIRATL